MHEFISTWVARHGATRDKLLPLLHALQEEVGHVDDSLVPAIAESLNLSRSDVHGVITFYHDFRRAPAGGHDVQLCSAESCPESGGAAMAEAAADRAGVGMEATRGAGQVTGERESSTKQRRAGTG